MQFEHLETFVAVVELKSFSKASKQLFLAQSTVSAKIRSLEELLDTRLIQRSTTGLILTSEGRVFYEYAREMIHLRDQSLIKMQDKASAISGPVAISASDIPSQYVLPLVVKALREEYPELLLIVHEFENQEVLSRVRKMECDLGITTTSFAIQEFIYTPFLEDRMIVIAPNAEEYRSIGPNASPQILQKLPFIARESPSAIKNEYDTLLAELGIPSHTMNIVAQLYGAEGVQSAVMQGLGVTITSELVAHAAIQKGLVIKLPIELPPWHRQLYFVQRKRQSLSPAENAVKQFVIDFFGQYKELSSQAVI